MNDQSADGRELTSAALAQMIDISAVQAFHGEADIRALAEIATRHGFIAAHALPHFVPLLRSLVPRGGATLVGGPVGFPSGGHTTETKVLEARRLARDGAEELDMVINLGRLKSGDLSYVREEVAAVVQAVAPLPLKLILEITYLSERRAQARLRDRRRGRGGVRQDGHGLDGRADDGGAGPDDRRGRRRRNRHQGVRRHPLAGDDRGDGGARRHPVRRQYPRGRGAGGRMRGAAGRRPAARGASLTR